MVVSFNSICLGLCDRSSSCYFGGHLICNPYWYGGGEKVLLGGPWGRGRAIIARSTPQAGYGHSEPLSWVTANPHAGFNSHFSCSSLNSQTYVSTMHNQILHFHLFYLLTQNQSFFFFFLQLWDVSCLSTSVCLPPLSPSLMMSLILCLCLSFSTSVFWKGCISSLAVLLGRSGGVPGDVRVH